MHLAAGTGFIIAISTIHSHFRFRFKACRVSDLEDTKTDRQLRVEVAKVIELTQEQYRHFCNHLLDKSAPDLRDVPVEHHDLKLRQPRSEGSHEPAGCARRCGLSKTACLRRLIQGTEVKARPSQEIKELRTEIHHIGNNINQIARSDIFFKFALDLELTPAIIIGPPLYWKGVWRSSPSRK